MNWLCRLGIHFAWRVHSANWNLDTGVRVVVQVRICTGCSCMHPDDYNECVKFSHLYRKNGYLVPLLA